MGGKTVGGAFAASVKSLVQPGRASCRYFGERHSWPSHLQADLAAACLRYTNLGTWGGQKPWQIRCQSSQACYCFSRVFTGVLALPQAQRPSLVKLPIEESVVKVLPSASSTILFVLCSTWYILLNTVCFKFKVRLLSGMHLTCDG